MALLPDTGVLRYAGVQFDTLYHSRVSGQVQRDRANRATKYVDWQIQVDGLISSFNGRSVDSEWVNLRRQLTQPGFALYYTGKGFGPLIVNAAGSPIQDVAFGPKPHLLDFTPLGNGLGTAISWQVETSIPECSQAKFANTLLAFNWNTSLSFDTDAYAKFTVSGEFEIALNFGDSDTVENYRAYTEPPIPIGFRATDRTFKISDDKRTFVFNYTYEEMPPMGLPLGATIATGNYSVRSAPGATLNNRWEASMSATYTIRPDWPRREAYIRFAGLMMGRINTLGYADSGVGPAFAAFRTDPIPRTQSLISSQRTMPTAVATALARQYLVAGLFLTNLNFGVPAAFRPQTARNTFLMKSFGFNEGIYLGSKTITFDASWTFATNLSSILVASGVWSKPNDTRPNLWRAAMSEIMGYRSWSHWQFNTEDDVIVDVCSNPPPPLTTTTAQDAVSTRNLITGANGYVVNPRPLMTGAKLEGRWYDPDSGVLVEQGVTLPTFTAEGSWLEYQNNIEVELGSGMALMKTLPQAAYPVDTLASIDAFASDAQGATTGVNTTSKSKQADYCQRAATSTYRVCMSGVAIRAGYLVNIPSLVKFGGSVPVVDKQWTSGNRIVANYSGIPVYACAWKLWYHVPAPPTGTQIPPPNLYQGASFTNSPPGDIQVPISVPEQDEDNAGNTVGALQVPLG